ncbi:unnamed protein product [Rhizopus stolonifer]
MQTNLNRYLSIVDFLETINSQCKIVDFDSMDWISCYCYPIVDRALIGASKNESVLPYLSRVERMYLAIDNNQIIPESFQANLSLLWTSYSFLLLKAQTLDEQQSILNFIRYCINHGTIPKRLMQVAYLPLFQTLSELMDKTASKRIQTLKEDVLSLIHVLDETKDIDVDINTAKSSITEIIKFNDINGLLGHLATHVISSYSNNMPELSNKSLSNTSKDLGLLFKIPYTLSDDTQIQCKALTELSDLSVAQETSYKFPTLLFLLHIIRHSSKKPTTLLHIFYHILPSLADANDPVITSKVLQIITSVIHTEADTSLAALGVRSLAVVCERQPRAWQELKKVFTDWILRRKSRTLRRKIDLSVTGPTKLELAVLTTMRDMCKSKPRECAPDILPMIISLLQSCQDLSMASLSLIMDIVCTCVEAGFVEPRSIWSIVVVYIAQFSLDTGIERSLLLAKQLCRFYALAGDKDEVTEPYLQFKETILTRFIEPLLDNEISCEEAKSYALEALSHFSSNDISTILPEKAKDYLPVVLESRTPNKSYEHVLVKLMSNELDHMRRGLFKEESNKQTESVKKRGVNQIGEREREIERIFTEKWLEGHVAPGLRAGYATGILHISDFSSEPVPEHSIQSVSKTKWYRTMVTSFTDITLTDHLLIRVSSISSWQSFFQAVLKGKEVAAESIASILLSDLLSRLERSTVPGVSSNVLLAMTGLVSTLRLIIPSFAVSCANEIIDVLLKNYVNVFGSTISHSAHLMSEEVQFAARFALGHLSTHIISNEKTAASLSQALISAATKASNKTRNIDNAVDLVQFANGYAASHFISNVISWPTKTEPLDILGKQGLYQLLDYCNTPNICESRILGIMMGWASKLNPTAMEEVIWLAKDLVKSYLSGHSVNKGLLFGSAWVCAMYGTVGGDDIDEECINVLESAVFKASTDNQLAQHFYHFSVPYAQFCRSRLILSSEGENEGSDDYIKSFQREFERIQNDDPSSNYRIASIFDLGCLLGVTYLTVDQSDNLYIESRKYNVNARSIVWEKLIPVAGLIGRSAPVGNLKSGRIAAAVCGKIIGSSHLIANVSQTNERPAAPELLLLSTSSEPATYSRLNQNTSYIRAVFDNLVEMMERKEKSELQNRITLLLSSLLSTPGPLPPVNWFALINNISSLSKPLHHLCINFASAHAYTSLSLSEFLLSQLNSIVGPLKHTVDPQLSLLLSSEIGIGKVLELAGLPSVVKTQKEIAMRRGMNAVTKKTSISDSRCIEVIEGYAKKIMSFEEDTQKQFFATLFNHMPVQEITKEESKAKLGADIKNVILQEVTISFAARVELSTEPIFRQCVACSLTSPIQLSQDGSEKNYFNQTLSVNDTLGKIVAISELYLLASKGAQRQSLIKWITAATVYLIGQPSTSILDECWGVIAKTIQRDASNEQEMLAWIMRVLDAFIVYGNISEMSVDCVRNSMANGLFPILTCLLEQQLPRPVLETTDKEIQIADVVYKMSHMIDIGNNYTAEQEQIALRLFTLIDITGKSSSESFAKVIRNCPQPVINKGTTPYMKWVIV